MNYVISLLDTIMPSRIWGPIETTSLLSVLTNTLSCEPVSSASFSGYPRIVTSVLIHQTYLCRIYPNYHF